MGLAIFLLLDIPLHLLLFNLALDSLHLHALVLLLDFRLDLGTERVDLAVFLQVLNSLNLLFVVHYVALLLGHVCSSQVLKSDVATG